MIFVVCFLVAFFDGMDTAAVGYIAPSLLDDWGLEKKQLAPVLSAALFGLAIGAVSFGPVADKIGRKVVLTFSVFLFSAMCVASAYAQDLMQLTILRFITGLGLGAAMPNAVTLLTEFAQRKTCHDCEHDVLRFPNWRGSWRFFASWLIPEFGWRTALFWCGALPLILSVIIVFILPRSPSYLVVKKQPAEQIRKILKRINPAANLDNATFVVDEKKGAQQSENPMAMVMGSHFRAGSILLWASYFLGLIIFYAMINWIPVIFKEAQMPADLGPNFGFVCLGWLGRDCQRLSNGQVQRQ